MHSEKLLIIGCGDLGRRVHHKLTGSSVAVTGLRRYPLAQTNMHYLRADARNVRAMTEVIAEGFDAIVLTLTPTERSDAGYCDGYVRPCEVLVQALAGAERPPKKVILISSTAVYGQSDGEWISECSPTIPARYNGKRVLEAEQVLQQSPLPLTVVRLSGIYGPGRTRLLHKVASGQALPGNGWSNRIHADDAAGFVAHLITTEEPIAPLYLASDNLPVRYREVLNWLAQQLGVNVAPLQTANNLNKRVDNRRMLASGYKLQYPDYRAGFQAIFNEAKG